MERETNNGSAVQTRAVRLVQMWEIGFRSHESDSQWLALDQAAALGWKGQRPAMLGSAHANAAVEAALDFLMSRRVDWMERVAVPARRRCIHVR